MCAKLNIIFRLKDEDFNKHLIVDKDFALSRAGLCLETYNKIMVSKKVTHVTPYIGVYCNDGDIEYILTQYNTYDDVKNLILSGDTISINHESYLTYVHEYRHMSWINCCPVLMKKPQKIMRDTKEILIFENNNWNIITD